MNLQPIEATAWWRTCRWTLGLTAVMAAVNLGLFHVHSQVLASLIEWLQFDRQAILDGQFWRLITGNLVHWSREHFWLDVGVFLIVGLMYERQLSWRYPWVLLGSALAVGCGVMLLAPELATYRGLSGVDSGQFAAVLCIEVMLARTERRRWLWLAPAALIFTVKILHECTSGQMFFGTESLGDIGVPTPVAHAAGALAALVVVWVGAEKRWTWKVQTASPGSGRQAEC
jgi:rhomboid family GlyGly-CTERM serine protease